MVPDKHKGDCDDEDCICQGSLEKQNQRERYYKELVHMTMKADMSQYLQPASWRPGRAHGENSSLEDSRLETQEELVLQSES